MKSKEFYVTSDGTVHDTRELAQLHADSRYGKALQEIAWELFNNHTSTGHAVIKFIDENVGKLSALSQLKDDIELDGDKLRIRSSSNYRNWTKD